MAYFPLEFGSSFHGFRVYGFRKLLCDSASLWQVLTPAEKLTASPLEDEGNPQPLNPYSRSPKVGNPIASILKSNI